MCDLPKANPYQPPAVGPGDAAFTSDPTLLTVVMAGPGFSGFSAFGTPPSLSEFGVDGLAKKQLVLGPVSDPVWSSRGSLALVRGGWIWVGNPAKLRRLTPGSAPSWSPDGKQIAFQRRGWVLLRRVRGGSVRRLVQGSEPVWSPDSKLIAFFGKSHRLNVIPAGGGRVRHVGGVTGSTVDWQPLPAETPAPCQTPPGSTVIASSDAAVVTVDYREQPAVLEDLTSAAMGCLRADGLERHLASYEGFGGLISVTEAALAGPYAALVTRSPGYNRYNQTTYPTDGVTVFDLRTGAPVPDRGGEQAGCSYQYPGPPCDSMDSLVLGSDAVSAVHTTVRDNGCTCTVEQIQASDNATHLPRILDSTTEPDGSPPALTKLTLTGDTLTWDNNGIPRSAQLQP